MVIYSGESHTEAVHCHPPLFAAKSPSMKFSIKYFSPRPARISFTLSPPSSHSRQSSINDLTKKEAETILTRFSIQPYNVSPVHAVSIPFTSLIARPHRRVHDRESRLPLLPRIQMLLARLPLHVRKLLQKRPSHADARPDSHDVVVEVAPSHFLHPYAQTCVTSRLESAALTDFASLVENHPPADDAASQVRRQPRRVVSVDQVAPSLVLSNSGVLVIVLSAIS